MRKRGLILGTYNTAHHDWTLAALALTDPEQQTHYIEVIGRDGPLDFSTFLTDGEPKFGSRTLTATLETSEGSRDVRRHRIAALINALQGKRVDIRHPDYPAHYLTGRLTINVLYNDMAHAAVELTAVCDPWLYFLKEQTHTVYASTVPAVVTVTNNGRRTLVPQVVVAATDDVAAEDVSVCLTIAVEDGFKYVTLGVGTWQVPDLQLETGETAFGVNGKGVATITFREAVLR